MGINRSLRTAVAQGKHELVPQYRGVWEPVPYDVADLVRHNNSLFVSDGQTSANDVPGLSLLWKPVFDAKLLQSVEDAKVLYDDLVQNGSIALRNLEETRVNSDGLFRSIKDTTDLLLREANVGRVVTEGDLVNKPAGTYEIIESNQRLYWTGTEVQPGSRGPLLATAKDLNTVTPTRVAARDGLRIGPLGVPEMQPGHRENVGGQKVVLPQPSGMADSATGLSVQVGETNPRTQISAMPSIDYMAQYTDRDSTATLFNIVAPPSPVLQTSTFTATTLSSPELNWNYAKVGSYIRVEDGASVYTGIIIETHPSTNTVTVKTGWVKHGTYDPVTEKAQFGVPKNGSTVILNPITKVWGVNTNIYLYPFSYARKAAVVEAGIFNNLQDHDDGFDLNLEGSYSWGYDIVNLGSKRSGVGVIVREHWHTGALVRGADTFGYRTMRHPNPEWNPVYAFASMAGEPVALLSRNNPDGVRGEFENASGVRQLYRLGYGDAGNRTELDLGNVRLHQSIQEAGVLRTNAAAFISDGNIRATEFWVDGKKVIGARQPAIPHATAENVVATLNAVITAIETHGLTEVAK